MTCFFSIASNDTNLPSSTFYRTWVSNTAGLGRFFSERSRDLHFQPQGWRVRLQRSTLSPAASAFWEGPPYPSCWHILDKTHEFTCCSPKSCPKALHYRFFAIQQRSCFIVLQAPSQPSNSTSRCDYSSYLHWLFRLSGQLSSPCYLHTPRMFAELCSGWSSSEN